MHETSESWAGYRVARQSSEEACRLVWIAAGMTFALSAVAAAAATIIPKV
jgi:Na+/H+ antiporter NhaD/arsenite permease-like protein